MSLTVGDPAMQTPGIDFTMVQYPAPEPIVYGALSAAAVLAASAEGSPVSDVLRKAAAAVRTAFGHSRTIWAVARTPSGLSWEFYWYNNRRLDGVEYSDVQGALGAYLEFDLPSKLPPMPDVLSIDLGVDELSGLRPVDHVNIYSANPASKVPSGMCHRFDHSGVTLTGFYHQYPSDSKALAQRQVNMATHLIGRNLDEGLSQCSSVHVASKADRDGVYYSGIVVDQLLAFVRQVPFTVELEAHLVQMLDRLRHLRFDVGTDFMRGRKDPVKSAIYGVL